MGGVGRIVASGELVQGLRSAGQGFGGGSGGFFECGGG